MEIEDLIKSIDIVDYISQFVELDEKNGEYWGLSPFKDENTPSFSVRRETNSFYDFSSGIGGNVFTFERYMNRCSNREAVEALKKYAGLEDGNSCAQRAKMSATMICKRFMQPKNDKKKSSSGTKYPPTYMEKYEKKQDKLAAWEQEGISRASLDKFQVCYDSFSNRLVYPIKNISGEIVNIGGRTLDPMWKEKNLRKYTYFSGWGELNVIYGLFENLEEIKRKKEVIIFEGCKSVLLADTWGIHNTGALLTSHLNPRQMKILASIGARVVFALDKEVNIRNDHNIAKLKQYVNCEYLQDRDNMLSDKDAPVDKGVDVFKKLYEQRLRYR